MNPCCKGPSLSTFLGEKKAEIIENPFHCNFLQIRHTFCSPIFHFFWNKEFQKVHDGFYRVTEVLLHFLINTLWGKMYINHTFLEILSKLSNFFLIWYSLRFLFSLSWLIGIKHIWKTILSYQIICYCHQTKFLFSSSHDYRHKDDE